MFLLREVSPIYPLPLSAHLSAAVLDENETTRVGAPPFKRPADVSGSMRWYGASSAGLGPGRRRRLGLAWHGLAWRQALHQPHPTAEHGGAPRQHRASSAPASRADFAVRR